MSKHILPKIDKWTHPRKSYVDGYRALRVSLHVLPAHIQPYSDRHKEIYFELFDRFNGSFYKAVFEQIWTARTAGM